MLRVLFIVSCVLWPVSSAFSACPTAPISGSSDMILRFVPPVSGHAGIMSAATVVDKTAEGTLIYDTVVKTLKLCDGTVWLPLHNPVMAPGAVGQLQFSNGLGGLLSGNLLYWNNATSTMAVGVSAAVADTQHSLHLKGQGGEEGVSSIFLQDPTTNAQYGGRLYYDDREGQNALVLSTVALDEDYAYLYFLRSGNRHIGVSTKTPVASLDINGYMRLAMNASAPAACASTNRGSIALTSTAQRCICTPSGWQVANTAASCVW